MDETRRVVATLLHDVGKYIARTARNLEPGRPIAAPLCAMLLKDVYETYRGERASLRFNELERELRELVDDPRVQQVRERLRAIDACEAAARAGDPDALCLIVEDAIEIEKMLRALAREVSGP